MIRFLEMAGIYVDGMWQNWCTNNDKLDGGGLPGGNAGHEL
jgi:hypothetical protein